MNISLQNVDKVSALLTLKLEKADYQARVEKTLKTYRQKANIPTQQKLRVEIVSKNIALEKITEVLANEEKNTDQKLTEIGQILQIAQFLSQ